jgi:MFS family permease
MSLSILILSISIVSLGDALLTTVLGIRMPAAGFHLLWVGLIMSAYWVGYVLGGLTGGYLIEGVGRIRVFAGGTGLVTVAVLMTMLDVNPLVWGASRTLTGYGCALLFVAAESWLNAVATRQTRGVIFSAYMVATYFAMGAGQLFLLVLAPSDIRLTTLIATCFALAVVPVALARIRAPMLGPHSQFSLFSLIRLAPLAALGCALSGAATGAFYALVPAFAAARHFSPRIIAIFLVSAIFGSLASQWPLGWLSDRTDRRLVLMAVAAAVVVLAPILGVFSEVLAPLLLYLLAGLHGAFLAPTYPLAVAHANDRVERKDAVAVSGTLIIVNGGGSAIGPALAGLAMEKLGSGALFLLIGAACALISVGCIISIRSSRFTSQRTEPTALLHVRSAPGAMLHAQAQAQSAGATESGSNG